MNKNIKLIKVDLQDVAILYQYGNAYDFIKELCDEIGVDNVLIGIMKMHPVINKIKIDIEDAVR